MLHSLNLCQMKEISMFFSSKKRFLVQMDKLIDKLIIVTTDRASPHYPRFINVNNPGTCHLSVFRLKFFKVSFFYYFSANF